MTPTEAAANAKTRRRHVRLNVGSLGLPCGLFEVPKSGEPHPTAYGHVHVKEIFPNPWWRCEVAEVVLTAIDAVDDELALSELKLEDLDLLVGIDPATILNGCSCGSWTDQGGTGCSWWTFVSTVSSTGCNPSEDGCGGCCSTT
jgi:hypothetical protein